MLNDGGLIVGHRTEHILFKLRLLTEVGGHFYANPECLDMITISFRTV